jgi:hypothetical protein
MQRFSILNRGSKPRWFGPRADTQPIRRANSVAAGMPPALPREATSAKGDSGDDHRPGDDGEQELVVVSGI